jgi:muramidase (phage lysozyme)
MPERALLDFIAGLESGGNYNAVYGNARATRDLSAFTLDQINALQLAHGKRYGSSAFGRYQFIRKTLLGLRTRLGLSGADRFTPELQDRLALSLLVARGLRRWQRGEMSDERFMDALSREWASLPYRTGRSYYAGDGLNHALATREQVRAVLREMRG